MLNNSIDEITADIINSARMMIVENAVDEYILAEHDIMIESTTTADKMTDLHIDAGYDDETQYLEDDEEINAFIDACITSNIEGEENEFQDTIEECDPDDPCMCLDVEDVISDCDDLESFVDQYDLDSLINDTLDIDNM